MATFLLTEKQLAAIGSVAIESASLEQSLELIIWEVSGLKTNMGRIFTEDKQLGARVEMLKQALSERLGDPLSADFLFLFSQLGDLISKRNTVVHGEWTFPDCFFDVLNNNPLKAADELAGQTQAVRKRRNSKPRPVHADDAKKIADLFYLNHQLLWRLAIDHHLIGTYRLQLAALLRKPAQQIRTEIQSRHQKP